MSLEALISWIDSASWSISRYSTVFVKKRERIRCWFFIMD